MRLSTRQSDFLHLVDFSKVAAWIQPINGKPHPKVLRKTDMLAVARIFRSIDGDRPEWLERFETEISALADTDRPAYESWIDFFGSQVDSA